MYQEIGKHLDAGLETDLILLAFAKSLDSVCHKKLQQKAKVVLYVWPFTSMVLKLL